MAAGQELSRAGPTLRYLLTRGIDAAPRPEAPAAEARPDRVGQPGGGLFDAALIRDPGGETLVRTLVQVGPGGEAALRRAGARIGVRAGDIVTARVPLSALPELLTEAGVRSMESAAALRSQHRLDRGAARARAADNDSANVDARFDLLRRRAGERWEGLAGAGVIVGVYDSGLDLDHDDFLAPDGSTRVLFGWDQTGNGPGPGMVGGDVFDFGVECAAPRIETGECPMVDRIGHGTHVTGTVAGDGSATGLGMPPWRFPGGAPDADLIIVKGGDLLFSADLLVEGVAYIFNRAAELGRPAVVNVSLSSTEGPHDGTTLFERALDALSGPGRIVVVGAGNDGYHDNTFPPVPGGVKHGQGRNGSGSHAVRIPPYVPNDGSGNDGLLLELWYGGRDSLALTVRTPAGEAITVATGDSATLETPGGAVAILNALDGPSPLNGDHAAVIGIGDVAADRAPAPGLWALEVSPVAVNEGGEYHFWITGATMVEDPPHVEVGGLNRYLVGLPATADRVLSVGAHVTRHTWLGVGRQLQVFDYLERRGDIAFFSSPGPRRDGILKPDLTAPGKMLVSSLSSDATLWDDFPSMVEADSVHVALLGTSMAAPQVAAAVAILLQLEPDLTPEQVREHLRLSAATDAFVPTALPHPTWGAGKLDAAAAAERLRPDGLPGPEVAVALSANPVRSDGLVISYDAPPESMAIYTLVAERVRSFEGADIGPLTTVWPLDTDDGGDVANGAYVLVVEFPDRRVVKKLLVARP